MANVYKEEVGGLKLSDICKAPRTLEEELQSAYVLSEQNKGKKKKKNQDQILLENIKKGGSIHKADDDATLLANTFDPDGDPKSTKSNKQRQRQQTTSVDNLAFVDSENEIVQKKSTKQKKPTEIIDSQSPASLENVNEVVPKQQKKNKKTDVELKNESNKTDVAETATMSSEAAGGPQLPRTKKKVKKSGTRKKPEAVVNELPEEREEHVEPLNNVQPKPRKKKKKLVPNGGEEPVNGATAGPSTALHSADAAADDDRILQVTIHRTDKLKSDLYIIHPVVRVNIVDLATGKCVKKQTMDRRVSSYYETENENVDFIMPIMTVPFDLRKNQSSMPIWEENIVFNENFDYLCQTELNVMIFFEVLDFVSMRTTNKQVNNSQPDGGWYHIAWGFLKLRGANGQLNTGKKVRLQLYEPLNRNSVSKDGALQVYSWWKTSAHRTAYPSTLYVTIKSLVTPTLVNAAQRSMFAVQQERDQFGSASMLALAEGTSDSSAVRDPSMWSRIPGQQCRIPNAPLVNLTARRKGCYVLRFSNSGKSLACGCHDKDGYPILIYEIPSGRLKSELLGHYGIIYDLSWSSSDRGLMSASGDGTARVWEAEKTTSSACKLLPHPSFVYTAKYHPQVGRVVVTGGFDRVIRVWSLLSDGTHGILLQEIDNHVGFVNALCFDEDGAKLFSGDSLGNIHVWNVHVSNEQTSPGVSKNWALDKKISHKDIVGNAINILQLHPSGRRLLVHTRNNKLQMIDLRVESIITKYVGALNFREHVRSVITPCGAFVFAGSEDGLAYVWNTESGDLVYTYSSLGYDSAVVDVDYHPFEHMVAFCTYGASQQIKVYKYDAQAARREAIEPFSESAKADATLEAGASTRSANNTLFSATTSDPDVTNATRLQRVMSKLNSVTAFQETLQSLKARNTNSGIRSEWIPGAVGDHTSLLMSYAGRQPQINITRTGPRATLTFKDSLKATDRTFDEVRVLYEYRAQRSDELDLQPGQRIKLLYKDNENWWMGELENGQQGFFPSNYVAEMDASSVVTDSEKPPRSVRNNGEKTNVGQVKSVSAEKSKRITAVKTATGDIKFLSADEGSDTEEAASRRQNALKSRNATRRRESVELADMSGKS